MNNSPYILTNGWSMVQKHNFKFNEDPLHLTVVLHSIKCKLKNIDQKQIKEAFESLYLTKEAYFEKYGLYKPSYTDLENLKSKINDKTDDEYFECAVDWLLKRNWGYKLSLTYEELLSNIKPKGPKKYEELRKRLLKCRYDENDFCDKIGLGKKVTLSLDDQTEEFFISSISEFIDDDRVKEVFNDRAGYNNYDVDEDDLYQPQNFDFIRKVLPKSRFESKTVHNLNIKMNILNEKVDVVKERLKVLNSCKTKYTPSANDLMIMENIKLEPIIITACKKHSYTQLSSLRTAHCIYQKPKFQHFNELKTLNRCLNNLNGLKLNDFVTYINPSFSNDSLLKTPILN